MKQIILVRHGQTTQDKSNPNRGLSSHGITQIVNLGQRLKPLTIPPATIIHSHTRRAAETAHILSQSLSIANIRPADLRIKHIDKISQIIHHQPAKTYLSLGHYRQYGVESPSQLVRRWTKILSSIPAETIILVSHEGSLEAFLFFQHSFKIKHKSFNKFFNYADYAIMV